MYAPLKTCFQARHWRWCQENWELEQTGNCGKSCGVTCSCHSVWDGRHKTSTSEPDWREPATMAKGEIVSQVQVSWLARTLAQSFSLDAILGNGISSWWIMVYVVAACWQSLLHALGHCLMPVVLSMRVSVCTSRLHPVWERPCTYVFVSVRQRKPTGRQSKAVTNLQEDSRSESTAVTTGGHWTWKRCKKMPTTPILISEFLLPKNPDQMGIKSNSNEKGSKRAQIFPWSPYRIISR